MSSHSLGLGLVCLWIAGGICSLKSPAADSHYQQEVL